MSLNDGWTDICSVGDLVDNSGVCALAGEQQVAIFKLVTGGTSQVFALSNWDPFGEANVLYRGLLASIDEGDGAQKYVLVSPLYKQRYCLKSGECIDEQSQKLKVFPSRIVDGTVQLAVAS